MHGPAGPTDDELVAAASAGDSAAFEQLLRRHANLMWSLAVHALGGGRGVAEAAVGLAWAEAWREVPHRDQRLPVVEWLLSTQVRACERTLPRWQPDPPPPPAAPDAAQAPAGAVEPWERLRAGLCRLPWSQRVAWLLVEVLGLGPRRAARVLDVPHPVLMELLVAARAALTRHVHDG